MTSTSYSCTWTVGGEEGRRRGGWQKDGAKRRLRRWQEKQQVETGGGERGQSAVTEAEAGEEADGKKGGGYGEGRRIQETIGRDPHGSRSAER